MTESGIEGRRRNARFSGAILKLATNPCSTSSLVCWQQTGVKMANAIGNVRASRSLKATVHRTDLQFRKEF
jgi:hypothetical protein